MPDVSPLSGSSPQFEPPRFEAPQFESPQFEDEAEDEFEDDEDDEDDEDGSFDDSDAADDFVDEEEADQGVNRLHGGSARAVLDHIARSLVDDPDAVLIDVNEGRNGLRLSLRVAPSDMGRVIGKRGRTAQAIRTVVRAAASHDGTDALVDIVDA